MYISYFRKITGVTAIFLASEGGYLDIVTKLVEAGADADPQSQEGGTPLMAAAQAGHLDVLEKLLEPVTMLACGTGPMFCSWLHRMAMPGL